MTSSGATPTASSVATAIGQFTPFLAPETNSTGTNEIKAQTFQSPIAGLLQQALQFWSTNSPTASSNGCAATQYVVLVTDGLPTIDVSGQNWPPLGSTSAAHYGVTATFNPDGSLGSTNDQALTDTITALQALSAAGIKTYIIGLGAVAARRSACNLVAAVTVRDGRRGGHQCVFPGHQSRRPDPRHAGHSCPRPAEQSTASATVNTAGLNTSSVAFQPSFDTRDTDQDWTGDIKAYLIN